MWIMFAFASAFFAGMTSILAKCGIKKTDSNIATAIRTVVVLFFAWLMVGIVGSWKEIPDITGSIWLFLVLSGIATGASWLCYFRALQRGDVNKVVPVDKSSTILTIVLAMLFLHEAVSPAKVVAVIMIGIGTYLMIEKKAPDSDGEASEKGCRGKGGKSWLFYAALSAIFASLTAILGKVGIEGLESNLGTAIRTGVVLVMAWLMVLVTKKGSNVRHISGKELFFICFSGLATGASWLCYYKALQDGPASVVVPIDKLSILVSIFFSYLIFHEKLSAKAMAGLCLIVAGTLAMVIFTG